MLVQREYKRRHDNIARNVHWELCGEIGLERATKWYDHKPEGVKKREISRFCYISISSVIVRLKQGNRILY